MVITTAKPVVNWHSLPTWVEVYTLVPSLYVKETPSTKVLSFTIEPAAAPTAPPPTAPAVVPELLPDPTLWPITPPATAPISAPKACAFRLFWALSTATFAGRMEIILTVLVYCLVFS